MDNVYVAQRVSDAIVKNSSVSLSPTLSKNEKVKQCIRKKTHKLTTLKFWVKSGVIPLCMTQFGPSIGLVDIGECEDYYLFRVSTLKNSF